MTHLEKINRIYTKYINDDNYVFKSCQNQWIVILQRLPNTISNEKRSGIFDKKFAKFRGNMFKVIRIFNKFFPTYTLKDVTNSTFTKKILTYRSGRNVEIYDYDKDITVNLFILGHRNIIMHYHHNICFFF